MAGTIVLTGREKDTIVLSNGENIEPQPIEDACCASNYISQMIVVGNDRRRLGALVAPCLEAFQELEAVKGDFHVFQGGGLSPLAFPKSFKPHNF